VTVIYFSLTMEVNEAGRMTTSDETNEISLRGAAWRTSDEVARLALKPERGISCVAP
jgi:hypothetical protein